MRPEGFFRYQLTLAPLGSGGPERGASAAGLCLAQAAPWELQEAVCECYIFRHLGPSVECCELQEAQCENCNVMHLGFYAQSCELLEPLCESCIFM